MLKVISETFGLKFPESIVCLNGKAITADTESISQLKSEIEDRLRAGLTGLVGGKGTSTDGYYSIPSLSGKKWYVGTSTDGYYSQYSMGTSYNPYYYTFKF